MNFFKKNLFSGLVFCDSTANMLVLFNVAKAALWMPSTPTPSSKLLIAMLLPHTYYQAQLTMYKSILNEAQRDIKGHGLLHVQPQMVALHPVKEKFYVAILSKILSLYQLVCGFHLNILKVSENEVSSLCLLCTFKLMTHGYWSHAIIQWFTCMVVVEIHTSDEARVEWISLPSTGNLSLLPSADNIISITQRSCQFWKMLLICHLTNHLQSIQEWICMWPSEEIW